MIKLVTFLNIIANLLFSALIKTKLNSNNQILLLL